MHKLKSLFYFFAICLFSLTACSDDDDEGPRVPANTATINNQSINLNRAYLLPGNSTNSINNYVFVIESSTGDDFTAFSIFLPAGQEDIVGTYAANASGTQANTFSAATLGIDCGENASGQYVCANRYNTDNNNPSGNLVISKSGNVYTVDFDAQFIPENGGDAMQGLGNFVGGIFGAP